MKRISLEMSWREVILIKIFENFTLKVYRKGIEDGFNLRT